MSIILSSVQLWPGQMRLGDFNGDRKLDLLTSHFNHDLGITPAPIQVFLGDGLGNFTEQTSAVFSTGIPYTNFVPRIFTADFNNDGIDDIFCPDFGLDAAPFPGGQNSFYLSSTVTSTLADMTSTLPQALRQNHGTSIGDVNGDGYLDILVNALNDSSGNANDLLINDGTGHFSSRPNLLPSLETAKTYNAGRTSSLLADLNNDGRADMLLGTWDANPNPSQLYLNQNGSFSSSAAVSLPRSGVASEIILDIQPIDLNGDDLPDLALSVTNGSSNFSYGQNAYQVAYIQLLVNAGNGQFRDETSIRLPQSLTPINSANWYLSVSPIDLNRDGFHDLVADFGGNTAKIFMNDGAGNFTEIWRGADRLAVGDINSDGMPELVSTYGFDYTVVNNPFTNQHIYKANFNGDALVGSTGNDTFYARSGHDIFTGNGGTDTVIFGGSHAGHTIIKTSNGYTVTDTSIISNRTDLTDVDRLQFSDTRVALDLDGNGGKVAKIIGVVFGPASIQNKSYVGIGLNFLDDGVSYEALMNLALGTAGAKTTEQVVDLLYTNVFGHAPTTAEAKPFVDMLNGGTSAAALGVMAAETDLLAVRIDLMGLQQTGIEYT